MTGTLVGLAVAMMIGSAQSYESTPPVDGVFGLSVVDDAAAIAFWVPLAEGQALVGFDWFNNDGAAVFPEVLAVAGDLSGLEALNDATVVGTNASGGDSAWSRFEFEVPLFSEATGLYVMLKLPQGSSCVSVGRGGGAGVGYQQGVGEPRCWFSVGGEPWEALAGSCQMAVVCDVVADKTMRGATIRRTVGSVESSHAAEPTSEPLRLSMGVSPNPANPRAVLEFTVPEGGDVELSVFDLRGARVRTLHLGAMEAGVHQIAWSGTDDHGRSVPSGVYLTRLVTLGGTIVRQFTLLQ